MVKKNFDSDAFYRDLSRGVEARGVNWKHVSDATGVSSSTLSRMADGRHPDAASLAALSAWAGLNPADYVRDVEAERVDDAEAMRLWREAGLPEYFLGNGGTNAKLVRFVELAQQAAVCHGIHYPKCWDAAAYPTVGSALAEMVARFRCTNDDCLMLNGLTEAETNATASVAGLIHHPGTSCRVQNEAGACGCAWGECVLGRTALDIAARQLAKAETSATASVSGLLGEQPPHDRGVSPPNSALIARHRKACFDFATCEPKDADRLGREVFAAAQALEAALIVRTKPSGFDAAMVKLHTLATDPELYPELRPILEFLSAMDEVLSDDLCDAYGVPRGSTRRDVTDDVPPKLDAWPFAGGVKDTK